jgi:hypothetical protein
MAYSIRMTIHLSSRNDGRANAVADAAWKVDGKSERLASSPVGFLIARSRRPHAPEAMVRRAVAAKQVRPRLRTAGVERSATAVSRATQVGPPA